MHYIVEISRLDGDDTTIYLEADSESVECLFAVVAIENGASIVDNGYRSIEEAKAAWPEAIPPKPYHLTPPAVAENCTVEGKWQGKLT